MLNAENHPPNNFPSLVFSAKKEPQATAGGFPHAAAPFGSNPHSQHSHDASSTTNVHSQVHEPDLELELDEEVKVPCWEEGAMGELEQII